MRPKTETVNHINGNATASPNRATKIDLSSPPPTCAATRDTQTRSWSGWTAARAGFSHTPSFCVAGCPAPTEKQAHSWGATDQATGMRTCTVCGAAGKDPNWTAPPAEHVHAWSGWTDAGDGANHKRTCSAAGCPAPTELQPHTWGTTDPSTGARSCTVCGAGGQDPNWAPPATTPIPAPAA